MNRHRIVNAAMLLIAVVGCSGETPPPAESPIAKTEPAVPGPPVLAVGSECLIIPADPPRPVLIIEHAAVDQVLAGTKVRVVADPSPTDPFLNKWEKPERRRVTVNVLEGPLSGHAGGVERWHLQPVAK